MDGKAQLLLRTPPPFLGESLLGYVLRVTEENGYESPWQLFSTAGINQKESLSALFPIGKLANILGKTETEIGRHAYSIPISEGRREFQLLGKSLGHTLHHQPFRLRRPAICCKCIDETGYIDACWDLDAFIACPRHRCLLVDSCATCKEALTWFRPGLSTCKCGAALSDTHVQLADPPTIALMNILWAKVHGKPLIELENPCGLPMQWLDSVPLVSLLKLLRALARHASTPFPSRASKTHATASVLTNWPSGFHSYLAALNSKTMPTGFGLRKRFAPLYQSLFKHKSLGIDMDFMRKEFIRYGSEQCNDALVPLRMKGSEHASQRFISAAALAKRLQIHPKTALRLLRTGVVDSKQTETNTGIRFNIVDTISLGSQLRRTSNTITARKAGMYIGLPVSVLRALRNSGHYSPEPIACHLRGYWKEDLDALASRLNSINCRSSKPTDLGRTISIGHIMNRCSFGSINRKGDFIAEVLDGLIAPVARSGESFHSLRIDFGDLNSFRLRHAIHDERPVLSTNAAAKLIDCSGNAVHALLMNGLIKRPTNARSGILRSSIDAFLKEWISIRALASKLGASPSQVKRMTERGGVKLLELLMRDQSTARFVERRAVDTASLRP